MKKTQKRFVRNAVACLLVCAAAAGFRIREHDGLVAVWDCAEDTWFYVSDVPVSSLPEADRKSLQNGIFVPYPEEIPAVLEDFCS